MQFRKNPNILKDRPLFREYITPLIGFNLPHMIGEIYTFKNEYFLHITNNTNMVNIFLQEILKIGFS